MSNYEIDFWWWIHILHFKYVWNLPTLSLAWFFFFHIEFRTMWRAYCPNMYTVAIPENLHFASAAFLFPYHLKGVALVAELPAMYLKDLLWRRVPMTGIVQPTSWRDWPLPIDQNNSNWVRFLPMQNLAQRYQIETYQSSNRQVDAWLIIIPSARIICSFIHL